MAKNPEDRFADGEVMAVALEAALLGAALREQRPAQTPGGDIDVVPSSELPEAVEQERQPVDDAPAVGEFYPPASLLGYLDGLFQG